MSWNEVVLILGPPNLEITMNGIKGGHWEMPDGKVFDVHCDSDNNVSRTQVFTPQLKGEESEPELENEAARQ